jgi:hypothetical protein
MFNEIYVAIQQGQVLQHRWLEEMVWSQMTNSA